MHLAIKVEDLTTILKKNPKNTSLERIVKWKSDGEIVSVDAGTFSSKELDQLVQIAEKGKAANDENALKLLRKIQSYRQLLTNITGTKVKKLDALATALKGYIGKSSHKWLFKEEDDGIPLPWFVTNIKYTPGCTDTDGSWIPGNVQLSMKGYRRGSVCSSSETFTLSDLRGGKTAVEILQGSGLFLETPEAVQAYERQVEQYQKFSGLTGAQFTAIGQALTTKGWHTALTSMVRDEIPSRVVVDDFTNESDRDTTRESPLLATNFWLVREVETEGEEDEADTLTNVEVVEEQSISLPVHPYIQVFSFTHDEYIEIHVDYLKPYIYDQTVIDKLILPKHKKDLIGILIQGTTVLMGDIIKGKTGGIILLATGEPGTGKTLTAEIFSEEIQRPLYVVQCSQLGTDERQLEGNLKLVLQRASRWKAILLIDEADVYIHERGSDIQQNAIVGVFLRVLEYYKGILFMTSNRATILDDAILSRATAHIHYDMPDKAELTQIWQVLSKQFNMYLPNSVIEKLVSRFSNISGRNVKNLLKLSRLLSLREKKPITIDTIEYVSQFLDIKET